MEVATENEEEIVKTQSEEEHGKKDSPGIACAILTLKIVISCLIFVLIGGVVSGYNGLKPIMIEQEMFHNMCHHHVNQTEEKTCSKQIVRMDSMLQFSAGVLNAFTFVMGFLIDMARHGAFSISYLYFIFDIMSGVTIALLGVWIHFRELDKIFWFVSFFEIHNYFRFGAHVWYLLMPFFGVGLFFIFMGWSMEVPAAFGQVWQSVLCALIMAIFTSAWDASALVFYVFQYLILNLKVPILVVFFVYCGVCSGLFFFFGCCLCGTTPPFFHKWLFCGSRCPSVYSFLFVEKKKTKKKKDLSLKKMVRQYVNDYLCSRQYLLKKSWYYLFILLMFVTWKSIQMSQTYFIMTSIYNQALWLSNKDETTAKKYTNYFNMIFPILSIATIPFFAFTGYFGFVCEWACCGGSKEKREDLLVQLTCGLSRVLSPKNNEENGETSKKDEKEALIKPQEESMNNREEIKQQRKPMATVYGVLLGQIVCWFLFTVCSCVPVLEVQIGTYVFLTVSRIYGFMANYFCVLDFDTVNYGTNVGGVFFFGGWGVMATVGVNFLVLEYMGGNYLAMNLVYGGLGLFGHVCLVIVLICYLKWGYPKEDPKKDE